MEAEMETILNQAEDRFINPLYKFRKDEIGRSLSLSIFPLFLKSEFISLAL